MNQPRAYRRPLLAAAAFFALTLSALAQTTQESATKPAATRSAVSEEEIAALVRNLGDENFPFREAVEKKLFQLGRAALPALKEALLSSDFELTVRASKLVGEISVGLTPDTPPNIATLLRQYLTADTPATRVGVVANISNLGDKAVPYLLLIADYEIEPQVLAVVRARLFANPHATVHQMLSRGEIAQAGQFLETACQSGKYNSAMQEWAAFAVLRGNYDQACRKLQADIAATPAPPDPRRRPLQLRLAYLHRAQGESALALAAARETADPTFIHGVIVENADWSALLAWDGQPKLDVSRAYQAKAVRALAAYYAHDVPKLRQYMDEFRAAAREVGDSLDTCYPETLCFLNLPQEAIDSLVAQGRWSNAVELLASRGLYTEALALADRAQRDSAKDLRLVWVKQAIVLSALGETEAAQRSLDQAVADVIKDLAAAKEAAPPKDGNETPAGWETNVAIGQIVKVYFSMDQQDKALALAARFVDQFPPVDPAPRYCRLFYDLYAARESDGAAYLAVLHAMHPDMTWAAALKKTGNVLAHRVTADEMESVANEILRHVELNVRAPGAPPDPQHTERLQRWARRLQQDAEAAGVQGPTLEQLKRLSPVNRAIDEAWARQQLLKNRGQAAARDEDWTTMADAYRELAQVTNEQWPRYLQGYAKVRGGAKAEGETLQQQAQLLMLAASSEHYNLLRAAEAAGLSDVIAACSERNLRVGTPADVYWMNTAQSVALAGKVDDARAQHLLESHNVAYLGSGAAFVDGRPDIELYLAKRQHDFAARAAAARKDWPRALEEISAALALYPGEIDTTLELIPKLEAAGRQADADALFAAQFKYFQDLLARYPRAMTHHNQMAWLCARTKRQLDRALEHANTAVAAFPKNASFLDTQAEVHFARGEVQQAIAIEKHALELSPKWPLLQDQLKRFQAASP